MESVYYFPRPGAQRKLEPRAEAHLVALGCSQPPEDRSRWTMQLLADRLVPLGHVEVPKRSALVARSMARAIRNQADLNFGHRSEEPERRLTDE